MREYGIERGRGKSIALREEGERVWNRGRKVRVWH